MDKDNPVSTGMQRTLVLLKPDAVERGLVGRIIQRFEDCGLRIVEMKMLTPSRELAETHYADLGERWGEQVFAVTTSFLRSGPVVAIALEGIEAVAVVRKLIGSTAPSEAAPGTIRGDFAHQSQRHATAHGQAILNLVHASSSPEEAERELGLWFG